MLEDMPLSFQRHPSAGHLFLLVVLMTTVVYVQFEFWKQPIRGDRANWEYFAQVLARGGVPYRDAPNIKTPLSAYIGAAAIVGTRPLGVRDTMAVRVTFLTLAVLTVGFVFLVSLRYFASRRIAVLAALIFMAFDTLPLINSAGIQPKTPMILFGLVALWAMAEGRAFTAGFCSMLSALSWQAGLVFLGVGMLGFSRYLTRWRQPAVARFMVGAALPLTALVIHLWKTGSLREFYLWTIHFGLTVYIPGELRSLGEFGAYLARMVHKHRGDEIPHFWLATAGFGISVWSEIRMALKAGAARLLDRAPHHPVIMIPLVYLGICAVNSQGRGDMIPLLPFVAILSALALVRASDGAAAFLLRGSVASRRRACEVGAFGLICLVVVGFGLNKAFSYRRPFPTLEDQEGDIREMMSLLEPGDKVFVHGVTEILVLSHSSNAGGHFLLDRGKDAYLSNVEAGGFDGWLERLKAERPRIVSLGRLREVQRRAELERWADEAYVRRKGRVFEYFVRVGGLAPPWSQSRPVGWR